jgi:hypothetical protein
MRAMEQEYITNGDRTNVQVHWHNNSCLFRPNTQYTMLIAYEFFDALAIRVPQVVQGFASFKRGLC